MKTLIILSLFFISASSCSELIEAKSEPNFIFNNKEKIEIKDFEIFIEDADINTFKVTGNKIQIFSNLDLINFSEPTLLEIKKYSKTGEGLIKLNIILQNDKQINIGLGNYKDFIINTDFLPKSWQTVIIYLEGSENSPILKSEIGKFQDGKLLKYGI